MTDKELRDAAVEALKLTTVGYKNKHWTTPPEGSQWDKGLDLLAQIGQAAPPPPPPPTGVLEMRPPGWQGGDPHNPANFPGFTVLDVRNANRRLMLDNAKDYYLRVLEPLEKELWIEGGRHVVCFGFEVECVSGSNSYQDGTAVKIRFGANGGHVYLEGFYCHGQYLADGVGVATGDKTQRGVGRDVTLQNFRVDRVLDIAHADCVQVQQGVRNLRINRSTCRSERQVFFLGDHDGRIGSVEIARSDLIGQPGNKLFFRVAPNVTPVPYEVKLGPDVWTWAEPSRPDSPAQWVVPDDSGTMDGVASSDPRVEYRTYEAPDQQCDLANGILTWRTAARIIGQMHVGPRADQRPRAGLGFGYHSPGIA